MTDYVRTVTLPASSSTNVSHVRNCALQIVNLNMAILSYSICSLDAIYDDNKQSLLIHCSHISEISDVATKFHEV